MALGVAKQTYKSFSGQRRGRGEPNTLLKTELIFYTTCHILTTEKDKSNRVCDVRLFVELSGVSHKNRQHLVYKTVLTKRQLR